MRFWVSVWRAYAADFFTLCFLLLLLLPIAADEPTPGADMSRAPAAGTKRHIVTLQRAADQDGCAGQHSVVRLRIFRHALNGFVADLTPTAVDRLKRDSRVLGVEEDRVVAEAGNQIIPTGLRRMEVDPFPVAKIDGLDERINVDVAVEDSGIQANHPDLNVVQSVDFTGQGLVGGSDHGTRCAGVIGALDNDFGVVGIAPGVRLWSVRTIRDDNTSFNSQLLAGFDYVALHSD